MRRRIDRLRGELAGAPLGAQARKSARGLAEQARALAVELDELGGVVAAAPEPEPEVVRCECSSPMPDGTGGA